MSAVGSFQSLLRTIVAGPSRNDSSDGRSQVGILNGSNVQSYTLGLEKSVCLETPGREGSVVPIHTEHKHSQHVEHAVTAVTLQVPT